MRDIRIVNPQGQPINLTNRQKNEIYRNAKRLSEQLKDRMCTKRECENPTEQNVKKMILSEFKSRNDMEIYKKSMQAIGAEPNDISPERLRRR